MMYDGEGHRVEQQGVVSGTTTTTVYVGGLEEVKTSGASTTTTTYYALGGQRIALSVNGTLSYLASDLLGSATVALDGAGNVTASQLFAPYGTSRYSNGTMPTDRGFTGQHADAVTGLNYYNARYYDSIIGQFASADTVLDGLNRYVYVGGNPETKVDPTGHKLIGCEFGDCGSGSQPTPTPTPKPKPVPAPTPSPSRGSGGGSLYQAGKAVLDYAGLGAGAESDATSIWRDKVLMRKVIPVKAHTRTIGSGPRAGEVIQVKAYARTRPGAIAKGGRFGAWSKAFRAVGWILLGAYFAVDAVDYGTSYYETHDAADEGQRVKKAVVAGIIHAGITTAGTLVGAFVGGRIGGGVGAVIGGLIGGPSAATGAPEAVGEIIGSVAGSFAGGPPVGNWANDRAK